MLINKRVYSRVSSVEHLGGKTYSKPHPSSCVRGKLMLQRSPGIAATRGTQKQTVHRCQTSRSARPSRTESRLQTDCIRLLFVLIFSKFLFFLGVPTVCVPKSSSFSNFSSPSPEWKVNSSSVDVLPQFGEFAFFSNGLRKQRIRS